MIIFNLVVAKDLMILLKTFKTEISYRGQLQENSTQEAQQDAWDLPLYLSNYYPLKKKNIKLFTSATVNKKKKKKKKTHIHTHTKTKEYLGTYCIPKERLLYIEFFYKGKYISNS